jgi:hypothetical protein
LLSCWSTWNLPVFQDWFVNFINNLRVGHHFGSSRTRHITGAKINTFKLGDPVFNGGIRWCIFQ